MKFIVSILTLLMVISCTIEEEEYVDEYALPEPVGFSQMLFNEQDWELTPYCSFTYEAEDTVTFSFLQLSSQGLSQMSFTVYKIPLRTLNYSLQRRIPNTPLSLGTTSLNTGDGDILYNVYLLNEEDEVEDFIEISSYNATTREIKGTFQASFVVDKETYFDTSRPDTIIITNGVFETIVRDR